MPTFMVGINFLWIIAVLGVPALFFGVRAWLGYRRLHSDAVSDWDYLVCENMQDLRLSKDAYVRAYKKVNAPRAVLYLAATIAVIAAMTIPALALINGGLWTFWLLTEKSRDFEPGYLVWQFFIYFSLVAIWVIVALLAARRYHSKSPGLLRDQIIEERQNFTPETPYIFSHDVIHLWAPMEHSGQYKTLFENVLGMAGEAEKNWNGSGFDCDVYSGAGTGNVYVHLDKRGLENADKDMPWFSPETHPFFFSKQHAREDDVEQRYTIIRTMENAFGALEIAEADGPSFLKKSGNKASRLCSMNHLNLDKAGRTILLDVFLYEDGR